MNENVAYEAMKKRLAQVQAEEAQLEQTIGALKKSRDDNMLVNLMQRFDDEAFVGMRFKTDRDDWRLDKESKVNLDIRGEKENMGGVDMTFELVTKKFTSYSFSGISDSRRSDDFDPDTEKVARYYQVVAILLGNVDTVIGFLIDAYRLFDEQAAESKVALEQLVHERWDLEKAIKDIDAARRIDRIHKLLVEGKTFVESNTRRGETSYYAATIAKITAKTVKVDFYNAYKNEEGKITRYLCDTKSRRVTDSLWNILANSHHHSNASFRPVKNTLAQVLAIEPLDYDLENFDLMGIDVERFNKWLADEEAAKKTV